MVFEVGPMLGTVPLSLVYATFDVNAEPGERQIRDKFEATLQIVDGPDAAQSSLQVAGVVVEGSSDFDVNEGGVNDRVVDQGRSVEIARNGVVTVHLLGQHGLGRDWALFSTGQGVRAFCPPQVVAEGPGPKDMSWINMFTFTAMEPGVSQIDFAYRDSADSDVVLDTYRLTVTVR